MAQDSAPAGEPRRPPPALVVQVELEGTPRVCVIASSYEDEQRLRRWVARSSSARAALVEALDRLGEAA